MHDPLTTLSQVTYEGYFGLATEVVRVWDAVKQRQEDWASNQ